VLTTIASTGKLEDDTLAALEASVEEFRAGFVASDGSSLVGEEAPEGTVEAEQEQIVKQKKG